MAVPCHRQMPRLFGRGPFGAYIWKEIIGVTPCVTRYSTLRAWGPPNPGCTGYTPCTQGTSWVPRGTSSLLWLSGVCSSSTCSPPQASKASHHNLIKYHWVPCQTLIYDTCAPHAFCPFFLTILTSAHPILLSVLYHRHMLVKYLPHSPQVFLMSNPSYILVVTFHIYSFYTYYSLIYPFSWY